MFAKTAAPVMLANVVMNISLPSEWKSIEDIKKAFQNNAYDLPKVIVNSHNRYICKKNKLYWGCKGGYFSQQKG